MLPMDLHRGYLEDLHRDNIGLPKGYPKGYCRLH